MEKNSINISGINYLKLFIIVSSVHLLFDMIVPFERWISGDSLTLHEILDYFSISNYFLTGSVIAIIFIVDLYRSKKAERPLQ